MTKAHTKASPVFLRQILYGNKQVNAPMTIVDVRDVAEAHVRALQKAEAGGSRCVLAGDHPSLRFPALQQKTQELFPDLKIPKAKFHGGLMFTVAWYLWLSEFEKRVQDTDIAFDNSFSK